MGPYWSSRLLPALHPQSLTLFLLVSPMGFTCAQAQLGPVPCPVPSRSPPPRIPLAPVAAHGPTCCSPFHGTRWVFSKHHFGAWARGPVGLCHLPALCDKHLDLHAHRPTQGMGQGPWGPQPRAEWRCPEQPRPCERVWPRVAQCPQVSLTPSPQLFMSLTWEAAALSVFRGEWRPGRQRLAGMSPLSLCSEQPVHGWWEAVLLHVPGGAALGEVAVWPWGLAPPEPRRWRGRRGPVTIR